MIGDIRAFNDEILRKLRRDLGFMPIPVNIPRSAFLGVTNVMELAERGHRIPYVGRRHVKGFHFEGELFVDSSGWGADDEPALSFTQQAREMRKLVEWYWSRGKTLFWGVTLAGQFQVHVGYWTGRA